MKDLQKDHCHHQNCHCHHADEHCQCSDHHHVNCDCENEHQCECFIHESGCCYDSHLQLHECGCGHHHHDDVLEHSHHHGLTINFDGEIQSDINRVWHVLTDNTYIEQWSNGILIKDYRPGGQLTYHGESMMLLDIEPPVLLTFTWLGGTIAIELAAQNETSTLINFSYWIELIEEDSAIHLSEWMINLQSIAALAEGQQLGNRQKQFDEVIPKMREMLTLETQEEFEF